MELNLELALEGPVDLSHRFVLEIGHLERPELVSLEPVCFDGQLVKSEAGFVLSGKLQCGGEVACSRCLSAVKFSSLRDVTWVFSPTAEKAKSSNLDLALSRDDFDIVHYTQPKIPLEPFLEEELQLEIPLKSLCKEDCRGLCPQCGVDRNTQTCMCQPEVDRRWEGLEKLAKARK